MPGKQIGLVTAAVITIATMSGCIKTQSDVNVDVKPIEVKPIHITVDVNLKVDRKLDEFFDFQDEPTHKPAPTTVPSGS